MRQTHHENCGKEQHNKTIKNIRQYCTEEHLKLHRPEKLCFPFKVEQKDGVGRYLVATRDIQPMGEIDLMLNFSLFPGHVPFGVLDLPHRLSKLMMEHFQNLSSTTEHWLTDRSPMSLSSACSV